MAQAWPVALREQRVFDFDPDVVWLAPEPPGQEEADRFVYDPADPVPTRGGAPRSQMRFSRSLTR